MRYPKSKEEAKTWRYGVWSGEPKGKSYNPEKCAYKVLRVGGFISSQCLRKSGHGPDGAFCRQHAKIVLKDIKERMERDGKEG